MSNKFTGITSAGSAIPVYDKDAHSALAQKLDTAVYSAASGNFLTAIPDEYAKTSAVEDMVSAASADLNTAIGNKLDTSSFADVSGSFLTEVPESAVSGFATHEEVDEATSGKLDKSATYSLPYVKYSSGTSSINAPGAMYYYRDGNVIDFTVNDVISAQGNTNYTGNGYILAPSLSSNWRGLKTNHLTADAYGVSGGQTSTSYSGSSAGAFRIKANAEDPNPSIQLIGASYSYGNGVFIDVNGASAVDSYGNVKWAVGGPAPQLFNGGMDKQPPILLVASPIGSAYSANYSAVPHLSANNTSIEMSYGPTASAPNIQISPNGFTANYTSSHASFTTADATVSRYSAYNDPNKIEWSLTGSVQKREIECDSATSAITAIAGSAVGGGSTYSAGANIDITDDVISGKDWSEDIASATSGLQPAGDYYSASNPSGFLTEHQSLAGYMQTSGLEYDGDKISGYMGSAFKAGDELPSGVMVESAFNYNDSNRITGYNGSAFSQGGGADLDFGYDESGAISSINTSALSDSRAGTPLYVESPLYTGQSGSSAYIGWSGYNETKLWVSESTQGSNIQTFTLNEPYTSFERIKIFYRINDGDAGCAECLTANTHVDAITMANYSPANTGTDIAKALRYYLVNDNQISAAPSAAFKSLGSTAIGHEAYSVFYVQEIIGVNRKQA